MYTRIFVRASRALDSLPGSASSPRMLVSTFVATLSTFVTVRRLLVSFVAQPPSYGSARVCHCRRSRLLPAFIIVGPGRLSAVFDDNYKDNPPEGKYLQELFIHGVLAQHFSEQDGLTFIEKQTIPELWRVHRLGLHTDEMNLGCLLE